MGPDAPDLTQMARAPPKASAGRLPTEICIDATQDVLSDGLADAARPLEDIPSIATDENMRRMTGNPDATLRPHQKRIFHVLADIAQHPRVLWVSGVGSGKSIVFQLLAYSRPRLGIPVVVPLRALASDALRRFRESNVGLLPELFDVGVGGATPLPP